MNEKVVTFGEIMLCLSPPRFQRFTHATSFDARYGGAEAGVAVALANFGIEVEYVTCLPDNDLGQACLNFVRQFGIRTDNIVYGGDRIGILFKEIGAVQRGDKVIYDRVNSPMATIKPKMIDWDRVFSNAIWFHWSGITPAISEGAAAVCLEAVKKAKQMGLTVSCDLNYRKKLWKWGKPPQEVMSELVKYVDVLIANEEEANKALGIRVAGIDVTAGKVEVEKFRLVAERLVEKFPNLQKVAVTIRGSISASHNTWSGVLYDGKTFYTAPIYQITHIVDRSGAGDSFVGSLIYGLLTYGEDFQKALNFAVAASCLKHTTSTGVLMTTVQEVENLMSGNVSGRIRR